MDWFERLTGFREENPDQVRSNIAVDGDRLFSGVNGRTYRCGHLDTPSLGTLRKRVVGLSRAGGETKIEEVVGDVQKLHLDPTNAGSLFQVASQFNLLEMVSPSVTPERGVGIYEKDPTQGPACAIAAGAGTIYRNYFANVNGRIGQTADNQIDCLQDVGEALGNHGERLWEMRNGYALPTEAGLTEISATLTSADEDRYDRLLQSLRIGLHWDTEVTLNDERHIVTQAYCSALPVAYSPHPPDKWAPFARLILQASYEATICAAILNAEKTGNRRVFLTLLGGGVFGNKTEWIMEAIGRAVRKYPRHGLDVRIVSYSSPNKSVHRLIESLKT